MQADRVIARAYGDEARVCRLVNVLGNTAYIAEDKILIEIKETGDTSTLTVFRLADLFVYDETVKHGSHPDWSQLTLLRERP